MDLEKIDYSLYLDKTGTNFLVTVYSEDTDEDFDLDSPFTDMYLHIQGILEVNIEIMTEKVIENMTGSELTKEEYSYYDFRDLFRELFYAVRSEDYTISDSNLQALYKCIMERI